MAQLPISSRYSSSGSRFKFVFSSNPSRLITTAFFLHPLSSLLQESCQKWCSCEPKDPSLADWHKERSNGPELNATPQTHPSTPTCESVPPVGLLEKLRYHSYFSNTFSDSTKTPLIFYLRNIQKGWNFVHTLDQLNFLNLWWALITLHHLGKSLGSFLWCGDKFLLIPKSMEFQTAGLQNNIQIDKSAPRIQLHPAPQIDPNGFCRCRSYPKTWLLRLQRSWTKNMSMDRPYLFKMFIETTCFQNLHKIPGPGKIDW